MLGFGALGQYPLGPAVFDDLFSFLPSGEYRGRATSFSFRSAANAGETGDVLLTFATIIHPGLTSKAIRVVTEDDSGISYANGLPVNYRLNGELYKACPFRLAYLTDGERPAEGRASIPNVDGEIGETVRALTSPPMVHFQCILASAFDELFDQDNARNPVGTPFIEYDADFLFLRDVQGNELVVSGKLSTFDLGNEPYPPTRTTKDITPALYR